MNFIVFFTDQQRWDTLGVNGNPMGLTPNLDRLAREGTFFRQAVTPQPVCGPARSCLQTGQYATTTGVWRNGPGLRKQSPKLAECFRKAGYRTGYIGKWHLSEAGDDAVPKSNRAGYRDWLAANCVELCSGPYSARLWDTENREVQLPGYRSDAMVDAAIRYIGERSREEEPYLLYLSLLEPHHQNTDDSYPPPLGMATDYRGDWMPPDLQALGGSSARHWPGYCAMIRRIDEGLGRLVDALHSTGQWEDTVLVFISDHGCHFKTRNPEYKRSPHESSVRVPFVITGPGWRGGGQHDCPASLVDLAPTLLECAGIEVPGQMQGHSLLPVVRGGQPPVVDFSYIQFGDSFMPPGRALRSSRWKYAVTASSRHRGKATAPSYRESHLYDLRADPWELDNLIHSRAHGTVCRELREKLRRRIRETGEPPATIQTAKRPQAPSQRTVQYPNEGGAEGPVDGTWRKFSPSPGP
jgi:arylsulfatase A-like enzyme